MCTQFLNISIYFCMYLVVMITNGSHLQDKARINLISNPSFLVLCSQSYLINNRKYRYIDLFIILLHTKSMNMTVFLIPQEDHKQPIFGVQFYQLLNDDEKDPLVFATVGSNRVLFNFWLIVWVHKLCFCLPKSLCLSIYLVFGFLIH